MAIGNDKAQHYFSINGSMPLLYKFSDHKGKPKNCSLFSREMHEESCHSSKPFMIMS